MGSNVELHELKSAHLPEPVPYAVVTPPGYEQSAPLPLCLVLMGGGGSRQSLLDTLPRFEVWWSDGSLPPMVLATPSAGMSYYVELPDGPLRWDSFLAEDFLSHLRATCNVLPEASSTAITGISMGGYGALKLAFARPDQFCAVAAIQPILEPGLRDEQIGARNRIHHASGGPPELIGPARDAKVVEANNPANRAQANAEAIRESGLAIYFEAGDEDFVNAHDGTEFLHRVLWDLDIVHEYHLVRGGDHGGPTLIPRMRAAYTWIGSVLCGANPEPSPSEQAVTAWIEGGMAGDPPPVAPSSKEFLRVVRARLKPLREQAAVEDPNTNRRYGVLP
ncbi:MAG: alpha/beta hydrolase-fold protein [Bryobacteraceae bacterium]|jgi:S-formylglutathione hydrolase